MGVRPAMSQPRIEMNATILPNGKVIALGGSLNDEDTSTASLNADLYDPATNTFSSAGQNAYARLYHSNSLLLPDATVCSSVEIPRANIRSAYRSVFSGISFQFDEARPRGLLLPECPPRELAMVPFFKCRHPTRQYFLRGTDASSAPTHAFDMEQRMVGMTFSAGSGVLNVTRHPTAKSRLRVITCFFTEFRGSASVAQFCAIDAGPCGYSAKGTITSPSTDRHHRGAVSALLGIGQRS